jgi:hypothetical protein
VRRSQRAGILEGFLAVFLYAPYRCQACGTRFWRMGSARGAPSAPPVERREYERLPIRIPATILGTRGTFEAVATDISIRGCALRDASGVPTTGPFAVTLHVGDPPIEIAAARTCYVQTGVVGVEFRQITPVMQARLADYVAALFGARPPDPLTPRTEES